MTILWVLYGYSLAFSTQGMEQGAIGINTFIGGLDRSCSAG
jgi:ammonium transporter, Amt family